MEEYVVYVLYSKSHSKRYIGYTSNLIERFKSHNTLSKKGYTVRFRPWYVIHIEFFCNKKQAMEREHYFKTGIGRKWLYENTSIEI